LSESTLSIKSANWRFGLIVAGLGIMRQLRSAAPCARDAAVIHATAAARHAAVLSLDQPLARAARVANAALLLRRRKPRAQQSRAASSGGQLDVDVGHGVTAHLQSP
jgi:hypothetical protein